MSCALNYYTTCIIVCLRKWRPAIIQQLGSMSTVIHFLRAAVVAELVAHVVNVNLFLNFGSRLMCREVRKGFRKPMYYATAFASVTY